MAEEAPQEEIQYELPPELLGGVYANFALVHHQTEHELTIDFCQVTRNPPTGGPQVIRVVSRVHIARSFVTPLLQAISTNAFRLDDTLKQLKEGEPDEES